MLYIVDNYCILRVIGVPTNVAIIFWPGVQRPESKDILYYTHFVSFLPFFFGPFAAVSSLFILLSYEIDASHYV